MILFAINAFNWMRDNWKRVAIAAILAASFASGWYVRGYIAEAAQNKAIAAAVAQTKMEEAKLYEKEIESLKRDAKRRRAAKSASMDVYSAPSDTCTDSTLPAQWMHLIQDAYSGGTGQ